VRELDKAENDARPTAALSTNQCEFKNVKFLQRSTCNVRKSHTHTHSLSLSLSLSVSVSVSVSFSFFQI